MQKIYSTTFLAFLGLILSLTNLLADNCTTNSNGVWSTSTVWSCGRTPSTYYPGPDNATINHVLTSTDLSFANSQQIIMNSSGSLTVNGNLTISGSAIFTINSGTLTVTGNLTVSDGAQLILNGGTIIVNGDATANGGGGTYEIKSGTLQVAKALSITGSNSKMTNLGTITAKSLTVDGGNTNTLINSNILTITDKTTINSIFTNKGTFSTGKDLDVSGGNANFNNDSGTSTVGGNMTVTGSGKYTMKAGSTTVEKTFTNDGGATSTINGILTVKKTFTNSATINTDGNGTANEGILSWAAGFVHNWGGTVTPATLVTIAGNGSSTSVPRFNPFSLKTGQAVSALPIRLVSLDAQWTGSEVEVNWSTLLEEGFSHFLIERSSDAKTFVTIGQINGSGDSQTLRQYQFKDAKNNERVTYYRLQSVDHNGQYSYSKTISVNRPATEGIQLYPNPVLDQVVRVNVGYDESTLFALYTKTGLLVFSTTLQPGYNTISLPATVQPDLYLATLATTNHVERMRLVVK